jgi:hypothetical protein
VHGSKPGARDDQVQGVDLHVEYLLRPTRLVGSAARAERLDDV